MNQADLPSSQPARPVDRAFNKIAYPQFDPIAVANELLAPTFRHRGRQQVLLAGFCAWVLFPEIEWFRLNAMLFAATALWEEASADAVTRYTRDTIRKNRWTPAQVKRFQEEIWNQLDFLPIGGYANNTEFKRKLEEESADAELSVALARVWHFLVRDRIVTRDSSRPLSIGIGKELASRILKEERENAQGLSEKSIERSWEIHRRSIAFLYSAAMTRIPKRGMVLDLVRRGDFTVKIAKSVLPRWFGAAKYVDAEILPLLHKEVGIQPRFPNLIGLDVESDPSIALVLSPHQQQTIRTEYR